MSVITRPDHSKADAEAMIRRWGVETGAAWKGLYNLHMGGVNRILELGCKSVLEAGSGLGEFIVAASEKGLIVEGFDKNPYLHSYFGGQFPEHKQKYFRSDIKDYLISKEWDVLYTIEVFEHINDDDLDIFMEQVACKIRYIYFSSVPPSEQIKIYEQDIKAGIKTGSFEETEDDWDHINLKEKEDWKKFFSKYGFKFVRDEPVVASWGMIFENMPF